MILPRAREGRHRLPLLPTLLVVAAVATMLGLAAWQWQRAADKRALIERYEGARALSAAVPWPREPTAVAGALYRHSRLRCERVLGRRATSGRSGRGEAGWAQVARCALPGGGEAEVVLGWSRVPRLAEWTGGEVLGTVAPAGEGARLVASSPLAGLEPSAAPDPGDLPNNHLAYAGQWLFFAAAAAVIYVLALRRRGRG